MTEADIARDAERPEAERIEALQSLKQRVDPAIPAVAGDLLPQATGALAKATLDALERFAFASPAEVEPIARALAGAPAAESPDWMRLLGTLATPWARERLWVRAAGADGVAAAARDELARLGCDAAHLARDGQEAQHLRRTAATHQALGALDTGTPVDPELVNRLVASAGFSLLIKLLDADLVRGEALDPLSAFEPPADLPKAQRVLARRLHERLRSRAAS